MGLCLMFILFYKMPAGHWNFSYITTANATSKNSLEDRKFISAKRALDSAHKTLTWLKKNGYSTNLIFLADMKLNMDVKRFYVIQPDSNRMLATFLVAHGSGKGSTGDSVVCSNIPGSLCTSIGKYQLGKTLMGEYGKGYWMDGLEKTNNNARKRLIVFHYYLLQTTEEFGGHNYFSSGCPMLAKSSFDFCDSLIQKEGKPVLMWIYK